MLAFARQTHAHPETSPQTVNRYLSLIVSNDEAGDSRAGVAYTLMYGELPGATLRKQMDANADGRVSADELDAERRRVERRAAELFTFTVDDRPVATNVEGTVQLGPDDTVTAAPVVVELYAPHPLAAGTRRLRIEPGVEPPRLGETEVTLDLGQRWELVSGARGAGGDEKMTRAKFEGPRTSSIEDRSMTFVIRSKPGASGRPSSADVPLGIYATAAALLFAGSATTLALHLRRRRKGV